MVCGLDSEEFFQRVWGGFVSADAEILGFSGSFSPVLETHHKAFDSGLVLRDPCPLLDNKFDNLARSIQLFRFVITDVYARGFRDIHKKQH